MWSDIPPPIRSGRHYDHAPIVEAIIEIRCELPTETTLDVLAQAVDPAEFPHGARQVEFTGQLNVTEDEISGETTGQQIGHIFRRKDGRRIVQSRLSGFSYSWLAPYDRWETLADEAWLHWLRYREVARPQRATRLGLRYINRIDVPSAQIEIKDYLRTAIYVSPHLPQMVSGYFLQIEVPLSRFEASTTVTSTLVSPPQEDKTSLILDIDTSQQVAIQLGTPETDKAIRGRLETLRQAKNYVFEACITDATRGLIS